MFIDNYQWSDNEKSRWKRVAAENIRNYFSGFNFRCKCKARHDCPNGYRVQAVVDMDNGSSQMNVFASYVPNDRCNDDPGAVACYKRGSDSFELPQGSIDWREVMGIDGVSYNHNTLLHEVGHSLGLGHPCSPPDEYSCAPGNIMGNAGWQLTKEDFEKAFCSRINGLIGGTWTAEVWQ